MIKIPMIFLAILSTGAAFAQREIPMNTEKGNVTILFRNLTPGSYGDATLDAAIRNDTPFKIEFLMFELVGYNSSNADARVCGTIIGCWFDVFDAIEPGSSVQMRPPGEQIHLRES